MKNTLKLLLCLIMVSSSMTVFSQNDTLETETAFMNCLYNNLPENGKEFKSVLQKAEQKLIDKNYLKDTTGESYVALYKNLENLVDEELGNLGMTNLFISLQDNINPEESGKCMESVITSPKFENSKLNKFLQYTQALDEANLNFPAVIKEILAILDAKAFENDYYRMATFLMIEAINKVDSFHLELPKEVEQEFTQEELKNAFNVKLDDAQQLTVNGEKVTIDNIQKKVISYLKQNKSKSVIAIQITREADYGSFIKIQQKIVAGFDTVRDELAQEKYNRSYKDLTHSEQEKIKETYPLRIKEL